jgi:pimeloyl-ACP methyl ester carboxylesterase
VSLSRVITHDGLHLEMSAVAGAGAGSVVLAHATGFCKEVWGPVTARLTAPRLVTFDSRGHGGSDPPVPPLDWWLLARDVLSVVAAVVPGQPLVGVGHSSGGAAMIMAELLQPETFDALVLVEPIVYPPPHGRSDDHPLTQGALRRRSRFPDRATAREAYATRSAFSNWVPEALDAYVECGLTDDGRGGVTLTCPPEIEAEYYRSARAHGSWDRLGELQLPITIIAGAESAGQPDGLWQELASRVPRGRLVIVEGATHFVPMERPGRVVEAIEEALGTVRR